MLAHLHARTAVPIPIALAMFSFHMWVVFTGAPEVYYFRGTHLLFSLVLIFLWFRPSVSSTGRTTHEVVLDALLICGSIAAVGYLFIEHDYVLTRFYYVDDLRLSDANLGVM